MSNDPRRGGDLAREGPEPEEKNQVTRIAEDIKGVKQVDNRMTLRQS